MTICIAAICEKQSSLVLATDSMITNAVLSVEFEHPKRKMTQLSDSCIALTAGDALAYTELFQEVRQQIAKLRSPSVIEVVSNVKDCYQAIRSNEITERILKPRGFSGFPEFYQVQKCLVPDVALTIQNQIDRYNYGLQILVTGISDRQAHIYGVNDPGISSCFDALGFHAIGSGLPHAINTLIARGCHQDMPLYECLLIVYEAKKLAEKAPGVGSNRTDICIMDSRRTIEFPQDKIGVLHGIYQRWTRQEKDLEKDVNSLLGDIGG